MHRHYLTSSLAVLIAFSCMGTAATTSSPAPLALHDTANLLTNQERLRIHADMVAFSTASDCGMLLLTVPSLQQGTNNTDLTSVTKIIEAQIGPLPANSLAILISHADRKIGIEAGSALQERYTESTCNQITDSMMRYFSGGQYEFGIRYAIGQSETILTGKPPVRTRSAGASKTRDKRMLPPFLLSIAAILLLILRTNFIEGPITYASGRDNKHHPRSKHPFEGIGASHAWSRDN